MGTAYAHIELSNPRRAELPAIRVRAMADTGSLMMCVPEAVACELDLETESVRSVTLADGRRIDVPYAGPVRVRFGERSCFVGAFVMGDQALLGAIPMEDMDLVVSPSRRTVTPHPLGPDSPRVRL